MVDLSTTYLGIKLKNPLIVSASPLSEDIDNLLLMEEAGAAAVVFHSLFEEQIVLQNMGMAQDQRESLPEELKHIPDVDSFRHGASSYLAHVYQAKRAIGIPVIASLNGYYPGGWVQYAKLIESAGADALELNIYYLAAKPQVSGAEVEQMYLDLVRAIKANISIPVAVKLSPYFSAMANMAKRLDELDVDGLVLFNRFYQPDFDIDTFTVTPSITLSDSGELRLRLRWVAILYAFLKADMAITGGVHTAEDVIKSMLAGAKATMMTSALLKNGIPYLQNVLINLNQWLEDLEVNSIQELQGRMSQQNVAHPAAFERANYLKVLRTRTFD